jgi:hypothetical protein
MTSQVYHVSQLSFDRKRSPTVDEKAHASRPASHLRQRHQLPQAMKDQTDTVKEGPLIDYNVRGQSLRPFFRNQDRQWNGPIPSEAQE